MEGQRTSLLDSSKHYQVLIRFFSNVGLTFQIRYFGPHVEQSEIDSFVGDITPFVDFLLGTR